MNILIIGSGGREHALAWKAAQSPLVERVWVAPGNAGTASENKVINLSIADDDIKSLLDFAIDNKVDLTIVGPEKPLALGIVDQFTQAGLRCFGPTQAACKLESSKAFCKDFLLQHNIPTAHYATFQEVDPALQYLERQSYPIVIKADGLAAGKGVIIAHDYQSAKEAVQQMLTERRFGIASQTIVIEEFLCGEELSYIVMTDGTFILPFASSQDHKRRDDGDQGPNTGGMGAYSPAPILDEPLEQRILNTIIKPTLQALANSGTPFHGFLYAGLMIDSQGIPRVLEFNCRLGDPETQPLLMRLKSDLVGLCLAAVEGQLSAMTIEWDPRPAIAVVLASKGYPYDYLKNQPLPNNLSSLESPDQKIFHAGTACINNQLVSTGGRVLAVTTLGENLTKAQQNTYELLRRIDWQGGFYRNDIGNRAL